MAIQPVEGEKLPVKPVGVFPPTPPETIFGDASTPSPPEYPLPPPSKAPTEVLAIDEKTPDAHVPRDPRLIRLTGAHPFNVEAPLSDLYNEGFLTSPELFYVRNHGAVPEVKDEEIPDWEFTVEGLVENPLKITFRELLEEYENVTYPITLVCAGNRRKEQNVVRKSNGFSWGPAGVSNALFTGVVLGDVLRRAKPLRKAKYVCMEGADKLPNGYYGTSVKLNWAMDPNKGMMLAHKMNGEMLTPDHGKPLRVVIPGQIGGRSVKWLKKLIITEAPSDNWYHIYDNRVLPTSVTPEEAANDPRWWKDERYAIYDLNTNSAIAYPAHEERLDLATAPETYSVKGYAYGGGGRRVTRMELSLDKGKTWRLANIDYAEDRYREAAVDQKLFGGRLDMDWRETCFCWCFWNIDIPVSELKEASDIVVRGMDEGLHIQPRDMYWSVLGMMNNPWFRVTISLENGVLRFEHPTQPALMPGGWMEKVKNAGGNLTNGFWGEKIGTNEEAEVVTVEPVKEIKMTNDKVNKAISMQEVKKHDGEESPWFVVNGEVYDGTEFLQGHPGGAQSIISAAGMDSTEEFMAIHSETAKKMMPKYHIGTLDEASKRKLSEGVEEPEEPEEPREVFLDAKTWRKALIDTKQTISADTRIFTFKLDHENQTLGLPTGQHLMMRLRDPVTREAIIRSYTPLSESSQKGTLDVLVKLYLKTETMPGGKMTTALDSLPLGHPVDLRGPIGKFEYLGAGACSISGVRRDVKHFVLICGGSGITPIFQVLRAAMKDVPGPGPTCTLLDGNRTEGDILCREQLDAFAAKHPDRFNLAYVLSNASPEWTGLKGFIGKEVLGNYAKPRDDALVLLCGPEPMDRAVRAVLVEMGWKEKDMLSF
ncbi:uncharacterized protein K452DRAFT_238041 [Aplosporella prunicola CBS 121167]|uniref:Nitrate reductase n=1 Tax=Aplosporella prunicola CBS 121167 TaxID=1176127 RepID=A0A6A6AZB0_9PEZI|nr:uncharacterized protein K452DRAFT_238041 [Aplosporella prunicola CBS 121167]KAF2136117.1 hypothetical protein K452DRAFT_238041 [Aplosporella prunicola CBS 121167]